MSYAVKRVFHLHVTLNRVIPSLVIPANSHNTTAQQIRSDAHRCFPPDYSLNWTLAMDFSRLTASFQFSFFHLALCFRLSWILVCCFAHVPILLCRIVPEIVISILK